MAESFFGTLTQALLYRRSWPTKEPALNTIGDFIHRFYNRWRRHSTLGYTTLIKDETLMTRARIAA